MKKLGLMMAATVAATTMGAAAHATVFDFALATPTDTYSFSLDDSQGWAAFLGYSYGLVPVTSSTGTSSQIVGTINNGDILFGGIFSFVNYSDQPFAIESPDGTETINAGTYSGYDEYYTLPETLVVTDASAASAVSAAPEPGVWALMLAGVAMIGLTLRQGRRQRGTAMT